MRKSTDNEVRKFLIRSEEDYEMTKIHRFFFSSSQAAAQRITDMFTLFWGLDAGLWNLRGEAKKYFNNHPTPDPSKLNKPAKDEIVKGLKIHGLNLAAIANDYTWEYEEEFLAEILLIYATAIFDDWTDEFVAKSLDELNDSAKEEEPEENKSDDKGGKGTSNNKIIKKMRSGDFEPYLEELKKVDGSKASDCSRKGDGSDNGYIGKQILLYKYFKQCRNCVAHGDKTFSDKAEIAYIQVRNLTAEECDLKEIPEMVPSTAGSPFELKLRGVVGFTKVLLKIITYYDTLAAERTGLVNQ